MTRQPPDVDLRGLFLALQEELTAALRANRAAFTHPVARGDTAELDWVAMLSTYLPNRYQVSRAFVIDADGRQSEQIDLVIYDRQYCPLLFTRHGHRHIPAESVYAVFEVKQFLSAEHIAYAGSKAASVRGLRRTSARIPHAGGTYEPQPLFDIVAGILALDSTWRPPLGESLASALSTLSPECRLDLGCALQSGAFETSYAGDQTLSLRRTGPGVALINFFLTLLKRLQALATVPAIDLAQYGRALGDGL
jgi:hypothetical protein